MWEKKESDTQRGQQSQAGSRSEAPYPSPSLSPSATPARGRGSANIGPSLVIKGEVSGSEDLTIEGQVEGKIHMRDHNINIAQSGRVNAEIHAKGVVIYGEVNGNVFADDKIEIAETGRLVGDLSSPRIAISDGAQFRGSVDMSRSAQGQVRNQSNSGKERAQQVQVAAQGKMAG